jgi:hypothetical protein
MPFDARPSAATQGGLPSNIDVRITAARTENFVYPKSGEEATVLTVVYEPLDGDHAFEQVYSVGNPSRIVPTEDGESFMGASPDKNVDHATTGCNFYLFLKELTLVGFPEDKFADFKASVLVGLEGHLIRKKFPKLEGLERDKDPEVAVFSQIIKLPWGGKATKGAKAGTASKAATHAATQTATATAPATANGHSAGGAGTVEAYPDGAYTVEVLKDLLSKAPGNSLSKAAVKRDLYNALVNVKATKRGAAVAILNDNAALEAAGIAADETDVALMPA